MKWSVKSPTKPGTYVVEHHGGRYLVTLTPSTSPFQPALNASVLGAVEGTEGTEWVQFREGHLFWYGLLPEIDPRLSLPSKEPA